MAGQEQASTAALITLLTLWSAGGDRTPLSVVATGAGACLPDWPMWSIFGLRWREVPCCASNLATSIAAVGVRRLLMWIRSRMLGENRVWR